MKDQILNCTSTRELEDLDLENATSLEKAVVELLTNILQDGLYYDFVNNQSSFLSVNKDVDGNWYVGVLHDGSNTTVADVFDVENWYDEDWNETEKAENTFTTQPRVYFQL